MSDAAIICLTSIPPRFAVLGPTLESLLAQDLPPQEIRLHIPRRYRRFPEWDGRVPTVPRGIHLVRCEEDFGPASKVLPAVADLAGQAVDLLFCDDDQRYPPGWHRQFALMRRLQPGKALAAIGHQHLRLMAPPPGPRLQRPSRLELAVRDRLTEAAPGPEGRGPRYRRSGHANVLAGWAGAMVQPGFFDAAVFDLPPVLWAVDDVWLSGHLARRGVPIWVQAGLTLPVSRGDAKRRAALADAVIDGHDRRSADAAAILHFRDTWGIWPEPPVGPTRRVARRMLPQALRKRLYDLLPT